MAPHRGVLILVLGILSVVCCSVFTGIPAIIMGGGDLKKMDAGQMDPEGRQLTNVGRILGIASIALFFISLLGSILLLVGAMGTVAASGEISQVQ